LHVKFEKKFYGRNAPDPQTADSIPLGAPALRASAPRRPWGGLSPQILRLSPNRHHHMEKTEAGLKDLNTRNNTKILDCTTSE